MLVDPIALAVAGGAVVLVAVFWLRQLFVIIPARHFGIVERLGTFQRVAMPGMNTVLWPLESLKPVTWTTIDQTGALSRTTQQILSFENRQMDMPTVPCVSKDNIKIQVDVTLMCNVTQFDTAVYHTDDVMNLLYQAATQSIRASARSMEAARMTTDMETLGAMIQECLNRAIAGKGLTCTRCIIQELTIDDAIVRANQDIAVKQRNQEMLIAQERAESDRLQAKERADQERKLAAMKLRQQQDDAEQALAARKLEAQLRAERSQAEAKAANQRLAAQTEAELIALAAGREQLRYEALFKAGLGAEHVVQLETAKLHAQAMQGVTKVVYAPLEYWSHAKQRRVITASEDK